MEDKETHALLAGRSPDTSVVLQQKFIQFSLDTGILADNIAILPKNGTFAPPKMSLISINAL